MLMLLSSAAFFAGHQLLASSHGTSSLPTTPRGWVDAYEAAAIDNPGHVCTQLLSPQLASAYAATVHASCTKYFARTQSTSLQIQRVLQDGGAAVVELRQTIQRTDWNVVLSRRGTGWQAVDLVPGRPLR